MNTGEMQHLWTQVHCNSQATHQGKKMRAIDQPIGLDLVSSGNDST